MAKIKTTKTKESVAGFIRSVPDEKKQADSLQLVEIMSAITGEKPYMFGPTIIGFGNYHYKYESGHEGDAPIAGFSPRKAAITLYTMDFPGRDELLKDLGKHKLSVACIYIKKLDDISIPVLKKLILGSMKQVRKIYPG